MTKTKTEIAKIEKLMSKGLCMAISEYGEYQGGFSFCVKTQLQAYKAAYLYHYGKRISVVEAPHIKKWCVQIFDI